MLLLQATYCRWLMIYFPMNEHRVLLMAVHILKDLLRDLAKRRTAKLPLQLHASDRITSTFSCRLSDDGIVKWYSHRLN